MYERSSSIRSEPLARESALHTEARRLAGIASFLAWAGWLMAIYAGFGGLLWWIDLATLDNFTLLEALGLSLDVVAGPLFLALILAGLGHVSRVFALYVADQSGS